MATLAHQYRRFRVEVEKDMGETVYLEKQRRRNQLKRRIAGNYGHLCNEMSGQLVGRLLNERLQQVILGHLSKENNFPELALRAVQNELERDFSVTKEMLHISVAPRDEARALITL